MSSTLVRGDSPSQTIVQPPSRAMTKPPPMKRARSGPLADRMFGWAAKASALVTLVLLVSILVTLTMSAWPAISKYGLSFLTSTTWDPVQEDFGGLVMIYGTLATSLIALLIAVPVSFGIALFLTETCPTSLRRPLGTAIELLAAIPSIVYGMWGLLVFGPLLLTAPRIIVATMAPGPARSGVPSGTIPMLSLVPSVPAFLFPVRSCSAT